MLDYIRAEIYRGAKKLRFFERSGAIIRFIFILMGVSNGSRLSAKNSPCPALHPSFKTRYLGYSYQTPSEQELSFLNHSENCSFPVAWRYRFSALNAIHRPWMSGYLHIPDKRKFPAGFPAWSKFLNAVGATWECGGKIGPQSQLRYQWHAMIGAPKIQTLEFSHRRWKFQLFHIFNGSKQSIRQFQIRHQRRWLNAHWLQSRIILQNAPNRWAELIIQFKIVFHANSRAYFLLSSALDAIYASKVGLSARLLSDSKQTPTFHPLNVDKMAYPSEWRMNRLETTTGEICDEKQYLQYFESQEEDGQESNENSKVEALSRKAGPISQIQIRAPPVLQRQSQCLKDASFSETTIKNNRLDSESLCFQASTASGDEKSIEDSIGTFSLPCEEKPIVKISDRFQCLEAPKRKSSAKDEPRELNEEHFFSPSSLILDKDASSLKPTSGSDEIALQAGMARLERSESSSQKQFAWRLPKNLYPHSPSPLNAPSNECIAEVAPWKNSNGERNTGFFKLPITSRQAKSWMKRDISALPGEGFFECASPDRQGISYNRVSLAQLTMFSSKIIQLNSAQAQCIVLDCGQDSSNVPISLKMIVVGQPTALILLHESGFNIESLKTHNVLELTLALRSHDCPGDTPEDSSLQESICIGHSGICSLDPKCLLKKIQLCASNIFVDAPMIAETILVRAGIKIETLEEIFSPNHCLRHSKLNRDGESVAPSLVIGKKAEIRANAGILLENCDLNGCIIQEKAIPETLQLHSAHIHLFAWKSIDLCGTIRVMPSTQLERNGLEIQAKELTCLGSIQAPKAQVRWLADNIVLSQESRFEGARLWIERSQKLFSYCLENQWNILEHAQFDVDFWQHFGDLQCQSLSWIGKSFELFGQIKNSKGQGSFFGEDVTIHSEGRLFVEQGELIAQRIAIDSTMQNDLPSVHAKDHLKMIAHHLKLNARIESDHAIEIVALDYLQGGQLRAQGEITITAIVCELAPQVHISSQSQLVCYLNAELHSMFEDNPHQTKVQQAYLHLKRTKLNHLGRLILNEGSSLEAPSINIVKNAQDGLVTYKKSTLSSLFQGSTFSSEPFTQNKCRADTPFLAGHNIHLNVPVMACETLSLLGDELCLKPECNFTQISSSPDRSMAASHPSWLERLHLYSTRSIEIAASTQENFGAQSIQFNSPIITLQRNMDAAHDLSLNGKCLDINIELNVKKGKVALTAEKLVLHEDAKLRAMTLEATVKETILIERSSLQTPTIWSGDNVQLKAKNIEISAPIVSKMIEIEAKESIKILKNDDQLMEYEASPARQFETNAKGQGLFSENILQCQSSHIEINQPIYAGQELSINAENQLTVNGAIDAPSATIALKGQSIIFGNNIKILANHFHAQARQRIHSRPSKDDSKISVIALADLTLRADELAFEGDWMAYEQFTIQEFKTFSFQGTLHCRRGTLSIDALMSDAVNRKKCLETEMFLGAGSQLRSKEALTLKVSHLKRLTHAAPAPCEVTLETLFKSEQGIRVNTATLNLSPLCIEAESNVEIATEQSCHLEGTISSRQGNIMLGCSSESASKERPFLNISPELIIEAPAGTLTLDAKKIEIAVMEQHQFKKLYFSKQASEITLNGQVHRPLNFAHPHEITLSGDLRSPSALHLNSVGSLTLCAQSQWCAPSIHLKSDQSIKISGTLKRQDNQAAQEIVIESKDLAFGSTGLIIASTLKLSVDQSLKTLPHSQIQQIERFQMRSAEIHLHGSCRWENSAVHLVSAGLLTLSDFSLLKSGPIQLKGKVIQIDKKSYIEAKNMAIDSESQCCLAGKIACQEECLLSAKEMALSENAEIVAHDLTGKFSDSFKIEAHKENKWRVSLSNDAHLDAKVIEIAGGFQAKNNIHLHWMSACRLSGMMHSSEGSLCIRSVNPNRKNCQELSYLQNSTLYLQPQSQLKASQTCHLMAERINVQGNMSASAIHGYAKKVVYDWGAKITQAQHVSWTCDDLELREKFECDATLALLTETLRCLDKSALIAKQIHLSIKNAFHLPKTCQIKGKNQVTLKTPKFLNEATIQMGQSSLIEVGELTNHGTFVIRDDTLADNVPFNFYFSPYHSEEGEAPPCSIQYTLQQGILSLGRVENASFINPHLKKVRMGLKRMEKVL